MSNLCYLRKLRVAVTARIVAFKEFNSVEGKSNFVKLVKY